MDCVRPGVLLVRARCFRPASALMALDLPTFERPAKASSGGPAAGRSAARPAARQNTACEKTFMVGLEILIKSRLSDSGGAGMIRAMALAAAVAAGVAGQALAQGPAKAQGIAAQVCAACHAADGNSTAPANPKIAGQFPEYLNKQLRDFKPLASKKPARESAVMMGMVANLSESD